MPPLSIEANPPLRDAVSAFIGLGANLGDAAATLKAAIGGLSGLPATSLSTCSSFYRSAPLDAEGPDFLNAVVKLQTRLSAPELLAALQSIESEHGRQRPYRNAPRTLDLDLLVFGGGTIRSPWLNVPHPRLQERAFVLMPLAEIEPQIQIPGLGPVRPWLARLGKQRIVKESQPE